MTQIPKCPSRRPADFLLNLIAVLLAPMFLMATGGDLDLARAAAIETVKDYRARHNADLVAIAQIIAFGLAALCSLGRSMEDDVDVPTLLLLHGNANALSRSAEANRRAIRNDRNDEPAPRQAMPEQPERVEQEAAVAQAAYPIDTTIFLTAAAAAELFTEAEARLQTPEQTPGQAPFLPPESHSASDEKRHEAMWAIALANEASEITATIPNLPAGERRTATVRAAALGSAANELLTGVKALPPATPMQSDLA